MIQVQASKLLKGDKVFHPLGHRFIGEGKARTLTDKWRHVYTVNSKSTPSPGSGSIGFQALDSRGKKVRVSLYPTQVMDIERKGGK